MSTASLLSPTNVGITIGQADVFQDVTSSIQSSIAMSLRIVIIESALFVYTLWVVLAMVIVIQNGARSFSKRMMVLACVTMYAMAATHWAMSVRCVVLEQRNARTLLDLASSCIVALSNGAGCTAEVTGSQNLPTAQANLSLLTALLSVNIVLGDSIVLWRAWILWARNRMLQAVSLALLLSTTVTSCLCSASAGTPAEGMWGLSAFALSWGTNIWATGLISVKAWQYRRVIKHDLLGGNIRAQAEKVLTLFVDSGIIYCALWTVLVAGALSGKFPTAPASPEAKLASAILTLKESGLTTIIGMYPTALIILVALTKSYCERTLRFDSLPSLHFDSYHRRPTSRSDRSAMTLDTDIQPSARTASSVVPLDCSEPSTTAVSHSMVESTSEKTGDRFTREYFSVA